MTILAERALYTIPDVISLLSMGTSVIYEQIRAHRLEVVHPADGVT
ncbi:hypothetical protein GCM10009721_05400 [Terrabacter tumescens]|uniref:Excisionase n=1 Tax=Terrabacter tumescens TaxID=60443 RepID=A0ABQ2HJH9_9MICO|nr:hypothetical protein [Terrabacter tumescens]GGM83685.1 hypothetical protein GCM10009721_05400 [Terrabacter tumescens]